MVIAYGPTLWVPSLALWGVAGKAPRTCLVTQMGSSKQRTSSNRRFT